MQVLNVEIMRSIFMVLFMGLAILSLVIMVYAALNLDGTSRSLLLLAGISYVVGACCRDRCRQCAAQQSACSSCAGTSQALAFWKDSYMTRWVALNSLRTLACFLASGFTLAALIIR
jgi:uncharacterized membrane protein